MNTLFSQQMHDQTERPGQPLPLDTHQIIAHRYALAAELATDKVVLEIGAGHGLGAKLLSEQAQYYLAGEYAAENIDLLNQRDAPIPCVQFDAHQLPFCPESFDLVVALAMIYYLDLSQFLPQVYEILKPGGEFFFCTSNQDVPGFVPSPYTKAYYSVPELAALLSEQGFETSFFGAFPAGGGSLLKRRARAILKTSAKSLFRVLPNGGQAWQKLRSKSMGETAPLPMHVEEIETDDISRHALSAAHRNYDYRIIYGLAKKPQ